ncbi:MAG: hypothetical protein Q9O62_01515 [Ardenticatenia bacterium]|nr:hypothetical protein [Ardenticatenia bacterium]
MKCTVGEGYRTKTEDGHIVVELIGLQATNTPHYSVAHITVPAGTRSVVRRNRFDEVLIVESGRGLVTAQEEEYTVEPRAVVWLPAGTQYTVEAHQAEDLTVWAICVPAFRPEWSTTGKATVDWRAYRVPQGIERLRSHRRE